MFQTKVVQNFKLHFLCSKTFPWKSCRLWDNVENVVESDRPSMKIRCMLLSCWINKARKHTHTHTHTHTHSEYLILIAFPLQRWLRERAPMLGYIYIYIYMSFLVWSISFWINTRCIRKHIPYFVSCLVRFCRFPVLVWYAEWAST